MLGLLFHILLIVPNIIELVAVDALLHNDSILELPPPCFR